MQIAAQERCGCLWWTGSGVLSHYRPLGVPWAPNCSQKRLFRADNECRTSKNNMATRSRVSREACTDPSDVKNRRKSILTTLGLYMLRRPCCHADFLMSDTRCRRGKIVSDCNREPTVSEENRSFEIFIVGTHFRMLGLVSYLVSVSCF